MLGRGRPPFYNSTNKHGYASESIHWHSHRSYGHGYCRGLAESPFEVDLIDPFWMVDQRITIALSSRNLCVAVLLP